ncbi:unnamed protein product [Adineta ricciae]|nr:unnamed protein product [Adineta ricciae]
MGVVSTALSAINLVQDANLQQQVRTTIDTINILRDNMDVHASQIFQLTAGQIRSTEELYHTQMALNNTIKIVNEHSDMIRENRIAINTLAETIKALQKKLSTFIHNVETHFIHDSIEDILANKLNLRFMHHQDLPRVIDIIMQETNINLDKDNDDIPLFELASRLLIQQRVEFMPTPNTQRNDQDKMGNLIFISFFAATDKNQHQFSTFKLIPMPFNHENRRVKLAQLPSMVSISTKKMEIIQWTKEETTACRFELTSSCRETPPIRKNWQESCLFEILTDSKLTNCRIEEETEPIFVQKIGNKWAISTQNQTRCHRVMQKDQNQHIITTNNELTLPPIVLLATDNSTSLSCDHFFLPRPTSNNNKQIAIIEEQTITDEESYLIDLNHHIKNTTKWEKIPYVASNIQSMFEHLMKTPQSNGIKHIQTTWYEPLMPGVVVGVLVAIVSISIVCGYLMWITKMKKLTELINMPAT